jgi:hypothetical protein
MPGDEVKSGETRYTITGVYKAAVRGYHELEFIDDRGNSASFRYPDNTR